MRLSATCTIVARAKDWRKKQHLLIRSPTRQRFVESEAFESWVSPTSDGVVASDAEIASNAEIAPGLEIASGAEIAPGAEIVSDDAAGSTGMIALLGP